jgi:hypothetical protein
VVIERLVAIVDRIGEHARLDLAVCAIRRQLADQLDPCDAAQQEREPAIRQLLGADDLADAEPLVDRRPAVVALLEAGPQPSDAHVVVPREAVARELAITRLEHVERHETARQQHTIRQRKNR